ncbi:MAG: hypothetical protein ACI4JM_01885 [Oscillospiraceae bacterium]
MKIRYHIPDFVRHFKLNILLYETIQRHPEFFYDNIEIGSVYGTFPTSLWNGGRNFSGTVDDNYIAAVINQFNKRGIPVRFAFSNPLVTEEHLDDEFCNKCLRMADNGLNEVIVVSPVLEEYIRKNYPSYKIISSTCKQLRDEKSLNDEFTHDYSLVVLDYNWNNDFERLEKIPFKERCELLINPCCVPNCQRRGEHYRYIGEYQFELCECMKNPNKPFTMAEFECEHMQKTFYQTTKWKTHINPDDLYNKYVPMGYRNFKIEGRPLPDITVLESYMYYMAKPEYRDEARLYILSLLTKEYRHFN